MQKIFLGKIVSPIGLKGNVKCYLYSDDPVWTKTGASINDPVCKAGSHLDHEQNQLQVTCIQHPYSGNKNMAVCRIAGVNDINHLTPFIGKEIWLNREDLPELEEDTFYVNDVIGSTIMYNSENRGIVKHAHDFGSGIVLESSLNEFFHVKQVSKIENQCVFIIDGVLD